MTKYIRHPNTTCIICGKPIYKRKVEIERNKGRVFCSLICYGIGSRKEKPCLECGKLILAGQNKKTCSRACSNKYRSGIKYLVDRPKDKVKHYQSIKLRLIEQRGRKCERCNYSQYEILQVHHKDRNHTNNDFLNLELICPNCHCEEHFLEKSWLKKKLERKER